MDWSAYVLGTIFKHFSITLLQMHLFKFRNEMHFYVLIYVFEVHDWAEENY